MAASLTIEEEQGTYVGSLHPHNGYYAGDFSWLRTTTELPDADRTRSPFRAA